MTSGKHFSGKVAVKILIRNIDTREILITRDSQDSCFEIPGGRVDDGENLENALVRELQEELGISVSQNSARYLCSDVFYHDREKSFHMGIYFVVDVSSVIRFSIYNTLMKSKKCTGCLEKPIENILISPVFYLC